MASGRHALVTGAAGFIGRHLVSRLADAGWSVTALTLPGEPVPADWPAAARVVEGDVTDVDRLAAACAGHDAVFHLAAVVGDWGPWSLFERVTVGGTRNVLAAAGRATVVLASSIVVYGHRLGREVCSEDSPHGRPMGHYGRAKQMQEALAFDALGRGQDVRIVRPANVYGPGSRPWVDETVRLLRRGAPVLVDGGRGNAGLVWVGHVADVLALAAEPGVAEGEVFNACDGEDISWARYLGDLARIAQAPPPRGIPGRLAWPAARAMEILWRWARRPARPPLTREALNLVAGDLRIPSLRAARVLGHRRRTGYEEAMAAIAAYLEGR